MLHFFRASISPKKQEKANWRSQLHAQRPKMHSNPLEPLEKNCFWKKTTFTGHTQRLKNVLHVVSCAKHALQRPKHNANPSGLSERMFIV